MLQKIKDLYTKWCTTGIQIPFIHDPETNTPSITLMFYCVACFLSIISLILLHFNIITVTSTFMSLGFVIVGFITYRLRKLDKVSLDVKNESIELDGDSQNKDG